MIHQENLLRICTVQRLGLRQPPRRPGKLGQVVEGVRILRMIRSMAGFYRLGIALGQRDRFYILSSPLEFLDALIERRELIIGLRAWHHSAARVLKWLSQRRHQTRTEATPLSDTRMAPPSE